MTSVTSVTPLLISLLCLQYSKYASSIAALSFSKDGHLLAVASSYTYEEGEKSYDLTFSSTVFCNCFKKTVVTCAFVLFSHEPDAIFIRAVNEVEVKPKPKALTAPQ